MAGNYKTSNYVECSAQMMQLCSRKCFSKIALFVQTIDMVYRFRNYLNIMGWKG